MLNVESLEVLGSSLVFLGESVIFVSELLLFLVAHLVLVTVSNVDTEKFLVEEGEFVSDLECLQVLLVELDVVSPRFVVFTFFVGLTGGKSEFFLGHVVVVVIESKVFGGSGFMHLAFSHVFLCVLILLFPEDEILLGFLDMVNPEMLILLVFLMVEDVLSMLVLGEESVLLEKFVILGGDTKFDSLTLLGTLLETEMLHPLFVDTISKLSQVLVFGQELDNLVVLIFRDELMFLEESQELLE